MLILPDRTEQDRIVMLHAACLHPALIEGTVRKRQIRLLRLYFSHKKSFIRRMDLRFRPLQQIERFGRISLCLTDLRSQDRSITKIRA